jgi:acetyl esterase/lipase
MKKDMTDRILVLFLTLLAVFSASGQTGGNPLLRIADRYWMQPDVVYGAANNTPLKLDIWYPRDNPEPTPTLVYIHGGGWIFGSKEGAVYQFLPFLEKGWRVVNVEYRMASNSLAPAAVEDTRCALRWVFRNAAQYKFDPAKIVVTGHSAGGHLSLISAMLPQGSPLDNRCYGDEELRVAAVINWYGITDVNDLIAGTNLKNYAVMWVGSQSNAAEIARSVSPLTHVRSGLPPVLTIHGDKDDVVPYQHAVKLKSALDAAKVPNRLHTVKNGGHGMFAPGEYESAFDEIWSFLREHKIQP